MNKNKDSDQVTQCMKVSIYDSSAWLEFRGTPKTTGHNKTTHFAKIMDDIGKLHKATSKNPPNFPPSAYFRS